MRKESEQINGLIGPQPPGARNSCFLVSRYAHSLSMPVLALDIGNERNCLLGNHITELPGDLQIEYATTDRLRLGLEMNR